MWGFKKKAPEPETELTNIELLQGTEQWSEDPQGESSGTAMDYPEPSLVMEVPPPAKRKVAPNKVLISLLIAVGAVGGVGLFLATEEESSIMEAVSGLFGGSQENSVPPEMAANPTDAASSNESTAPNGESSQDTQAAEGNDAASDDDSSTTIGEDESDEEGEEGEEVADDSEEDSSETPFQYVRVGVVGDNSHLEPWLALERIEEWRATGQHDHTVMLEYFAHKKLWVRLSTLEVAIRQKALRDNEILSAAKDIHDIYRHDQIRRWLKRVAARDGAIFDTMKKALGV